MRVETIQRIASREIKNLLRVVARSVKGHPTGRQQGGPAGGARTLPTANCLFFILRPQQVRRTELHLNSVAPAY
jgi:hypothetical protein